MNLRLTLLLQCILISFLLNSQTIEPSIGVSKNTLQLELESLYTTQKLETQKINTYTTPNLLFRYGLSNAIELQLNIPFVKEELCKNKEVISSSHYIDDVQLGFSVNLWNEKKFISEASIMVRGIIPANNGLKFNGFGNVTSLNLSKKLPYNFLVSFNIGYITDFKNDHSGLYISNLNYDVNPKINLFIETQSAFDYKGGSSHNIATGIGYGIRNNLKIDLSIAKGINHSLFYTGGVLTWSINL